LILKINRKKIEPDIAVLEMVGRIALGRDCQEVEWRLEDLLKENHKKVIFDLAGVNHMDSTGVGILVMCAGKLRKAGGELRVAGASGMVDQILKVTKVDQIVGFYPTTDAAAQGFEVAPSGESA